MMRAALLSLAFLPLLACAQSWCPPGAEWSSRIWHPGGFSAPALEGVHHDRYAGDTLINGHLVQRIDRWDHRRAVGTNDHTAITLGPLFTSFENEVVHLHNTSGAPTDTLLWFAAAIGDSWSVPGMSQYRYVVLDTSTVVIGTQELRLSIIRAEHVNGGGPVDTLIERLGFLHFGLQPMNAYLLSPNGIVQELTCYRDLDLEVMLHTSTACDYDLGISQPHTIRLSIHPNPGTTHFTLDLPSGPHTITLFDATGRMVLHQRTTDVRPVIATEALPAGLYRITVRNEQGAVLGATWVKE